MAGVCAGDGSIAERRGVGVVVYLSLAVCGLVLDYDAVSVPRIIVSDPTRIAVTLFGATRSHPSRVIRVWLCCRGIAV